MPYHQYQVIRHASGKRLQFGVDGKLTKTPKTLAQAVQLPETTTREIISGKVRQNWESVTYQRRRENMIICWRLTGKGREYAYNQKVKIRKNLPPVTLPFNAKQLFLQNIEKGEASEVSEALLAQGYMQYNRKRVLQAGADMCREGYAVQVKKSGAIFGNV